MSQIVFKPQVTLTRVPQRPVRPPLPVSQPMSCALTYAPVYAHSYVPYPCSGLYPCVCPCLYSYLVPIPYLCSAFAIPCTILICLPPKHLLFPAYTGAVPLPVPLHKFCQ